MNQPLAWPPSPDGGERSIGDEVRDLVQRGELALAEMLLRRALRGLDPVEGAVMIDGLRQLLEVRRERSGG